MTPSLVWSTLEGGAERLGREEWSNVPRLHTELTSSELEWGEGQFRGRWRGALGRVRRQPRKTTGALVRGPFLFRRIISSMQRCSYWIFFIRAIIEPLVNTTSCLSAARQSSEWTQPCSRWERQDGQLACDSLGEGFQDRELLGGTLNRATFMLQQNPGCASVLVATGFDLQSSRPALASRWVVPVLVLLGTSCDGFAINSTGSSKAGKQYLIPLGLTSSQGTSRISCLTYLSDTSSSMEDHQCAHPL